MASVSAYKAGSFLARRLPERMSLLGARTAAAAASVSGDKSRLVAHNLERVLGRKLNMIERRRKVAEVYEWYSQYYLESFRLPSLSTADIDQGFSYSGFGGIEASTSSGKGAIIALPHLGGWEWAAFWVSGVARLPISAVVEPLQPPELFEWFLGLRESLGMNIIAADQNAGKEAIAVLRRGEVLCLPSDRDIAGNGVVVDFFGERTTLPAGPATLALRTGADLFPTGIYWREGTRFGEVRPPLVVEREGRLRDDIVRITQALAHEFEILIRMAPEQWHMLSPNWPSDYRLLGIDLPNHLKDLN